MATIVLAIAPRAHAVLPRFAPIDRAHADEETARAPRAGRALLERLVAAHLGVRPGRQSRHRGAEKIRLGRMQVAARGIAAQRPAVSAVRFPRREPEGELEEDGHVT